MREMKDSGVEWIGAIPIDWKIIKLKYLISIHSGESISNEQLIEDGAYEVYGGGEAIGLCNTFNTKASDILVGRVGARCGCVSYPQNNVWATDNALVISSNCNPTFLYYMLDSMKLNRLNTSNAQPLITGAKIKNSFIPFIFDKNEQTRIIDFLDNKCAQIDSIIDDIYHQIVILQEYKQSVITEAVTKGLDKNVAMKDSGIEWIGEIASNAKIIRLKHFAYMKGRIGWQGLKSTDFIEEGPYCITGTDFINGQVNWDTCYHVSEERYQMDPYIQVKIGDLLITKDGTIGKMAIISDLPYKACLNSHLLIVRPLNNKFTNKYLYYVMLSDIFSHYYSLVSNGTTMDSLSQEKMGNFSFPIYDTNIQHTITNYLDKKCAEIDAALADKQKQLDTLTEYKKSLIYEYVTGKKEVPADA